jgi:hypothetical protein
VIDNGTMVLQNGVDFLKIEPGSTPETCPTSYDDGNQIIGINIEEDPVPITFSGIELEQEVSSYISVVSTVRHISQLSRIVHCFSHPSQSVHMKHLHFTEGILKSSLEMSPESCILMNIARGIQVPFCWALF